MIKAPENIISTNEILKLCSSTLLPKLFWRCNLAFGSIFTLLYMAPDISTISTAIFIDYSNRPCFITGYIRKDKMVDVGTVRNHSHSVTSLFSPVARYGNYSWIYMYFMYFISAFLGVGRTTLYKKRLIYHPCKSWFIKKYYSFGIFIVTYFIGGLFWGAIWTGGLRSDTMGLKFCGIGWLYLLRSVLFDWLFDAVPKNNSQRLLRVVKIAVTQVTYAKCPN